jgi:2-alkyl-3-oxoalkanoate reductase
VKVLVTGGGGFLGRAVVRRLVRRGDAVTVFGRSEQPKLEALGVRVVRGDIADLAAVRKACQGAEAVIHCAAKAGVWGPREAYYSANVTGTRNVIAACREAGVQYLVHTSTPSVVYAGTEFSGADESLPIGSRFPCAYAETKALSEKVALAADDPAGLRVCAVRPHLIWGVGDPHLLPRVIEAAQKGRLRIVGDGLNKVDITHVENAALAHILALDALVAGRATGKSYFVSQGEPVALWPWINALLARLGMPRVGKHMSVGAAKLAGGALELLWHALPLKGEPPLTRFTAVELSHSHWFDISAARRDLGYAPEVSTEQGLDEYVAAYLKGKAGK